MNKICFQKKRPIKFSLNITRFHQFSNTKDDVNRNQSDTHSKKSKRKHKGEGRVTDVMRSWWGPYTRGTVLGRRTPEFLVELFRTIRSTSIYLCI